MQNTFSLKYTNNKKIQQNSFNPDGDTPEILTFWQQDKLLYKWFTSMCSEEKPVTGPTITEKGKSLDDTMKLCKSTFSDAQMRSNKKLPIRNLISRRNVR